MGAEYTFSFQNMNVERGLLWNQENAITRGVQINQAMGKYLTASFSWNDNYYSNRYSGLSGSLTFTKGAHSLAFIGMGYLGQTNWSNLATPVQNNSTMYVAMYTYTKNGWVIQPYIQYNGVPTNPTIGVPQGAQAWGGAILASKTLKKGWSMTGRLEYISSRKRRLEFFQHVVRPRKRGLVAHRNADVSVPEVLYPRGYFIRANQTASSRALLSVPLEHSGPRPAA